MSFDISHLQDEYNHQFELVKTEFYENSMPQQVSQTTRDFYVKESQFYPKSAK